MIVLPKMGLVKWDSINDFFSHEQLAANFQALDDHNHTPGKGALIPFGGLAEQSVGPANLNEEVYTHVAEHIGAGTITDSLIKTGTITSDKLAASAKPFVWYTPKVIGTPGEPKEENLASGTFATLPTPDEIKEVVVPANALVAVTYRAFVKTLDERPGAAAVFVNSNQLKCSEIGAPQLQEVSFEGSEAFQLIGTAHWGLSKGSGATSDVTTGQALALGEGTSHGGGILYITGLPAATYTISVKYKSEGGGKLFAKERRLLVATLGV